jgi:tetratricopeptide (TPR) repeat protein
MGLYAWTAAPNVTLLDSGEFMTAAMHFGVPHPTGYPLWTLLTWLFTLIPFGNAAWEINLFSGVCGALATGVVTMLFSSSTRWMLGELMSRWRGLNAILSVTIGLLFAFSFSMWSQAVIAEVYTLHALVIGLFLAALYAWLRRPESLALLLLPFFLLALSFSNHQLTLALAPVPFLAMLLVRRAIFWDLVVAGLLTVLVAYLGFAILSGEAPVLKTAIRFFYCVILGLLALVAVRRGRVEWTLIAYMPFVVALGLLPYAYMPLASSTNPPMNWAYTRTPEGFFFSFNRSQYGGSLTQQSLRSLGKLMGTAPAKAQPQADENPAARPAKSTLATMQEWVGFFWLQLGRSFTPLGVIAYFLSMLVVLRLGDLAKRSWVYILQIAFVLAAILQPVADGAQIDNGGWWLQMPYHSYTNFIFALLAGLGFAGGALSIFPKYPRLANLRYAMLALPLWPLFFNYDGCSQRGHWFGWQFGHDMLKELPRESVVFGGTDPGRFVPTYMILGESSQSPSVKRDPDFDRRDLYIITQNGVGEPLYRKYLADQYSAQRQLPANAFERWLGRATAYPEKPLVFPSEDEIKSAITAEMEAGAKRGLFDPSAPHSVVTRLIWEKNRDAHEFFVEESFPLTWSYDHALPHGLVYKINRQPLTEIPADVVKQDFDFWKNYIEKLLTDTLYAKDFDAQRSFSKLRATTGNLYRHRKMEAEAESAYREALRLWEGNGESLNALSSMLWQRGDFDGVLALLKPALDADPNNTGLWQIYFSTEKRKKLQGEIIALEDKLAEDPSNQENTEKLMQLYAGVGEVKKGSQLLEASIPRFANEPNFLRMAAEFGEGWQLPKAQITAADALVALEPDRPENYLLLAHAAIRIKDRNKFLSAAQSAVEKGGLPMREALEKIPIFQPILSDTQFQKILGKDKPR